ncbi:MAG: CDP-glucose 4,6-dehydratase [bacterium]
MDPRFWKGKKVLVTGHTGFQGAWFSLWMQSLGAKVVGFSLPPPTRPSLFELARVGDGMQSVVGDVRDLAALQTCFEDHRPEFAVHFAAQALVRRSYREPVLTIATNVLGTTHFLEAARHSPGLQAILCITSDKCYLPRALERGYRESDPLGGTDPYSASKAAAEWVIEAYRRSYVPGEAGSGLPPLASARAGNVIGGGDWAEDRLVPDAMQALLERRDIVLRHPEAVRPWQHVLDPLRGYLMLLERLSLRGEEFADAWNFGPGAETSKPVSYLAERLVSLWGEAAVCRGEAAPSWHEDAVLRLDATLAKERLGWEPILSLEEAAEWIVQWYRSYRQGRDVRELSLSQIKDYERRVLS